MSLRKPSVSSSHDSKRGSVKEAPNMINAFPYPQISEISAAQVSGSGSDENTRSVTPSESIYSFSTLTGSGRSTAERTAEDEDTIRVVIRARPMNTMEKQRADQKVLFCLDDGQTIQIQKNIDGQPVKPMTFHRVFDELTSQEQFFENSGIKDLVEKAVEGYNSTIFAYGQTGTGKTFSITGPDDVSYSPDDVVRWGLVPRSLKYIFSMISQAEEGSRSTVYASYLEIYNEQVHDLLNPTNTSLPIRFHAEKGFYVENMFVVECEVLDDCMAVLEEGLRNRRVASHRLNEHSSRSHGIMAVIVETETTDPEDGRVIRKKGKISFVDLAGSEKVKESQATGDTLTETLNINKSLLTLGNCISALADMKKSKKSNVHVPYRDSKLTKLLSDSLGGNGVALMIACVSPATLNVNESLNTLRYAARAKRIKNRPVIQMDPREELILKLRNELKLVKTENEQLRQSVMVMSMGKDADVGFDASLSKSNSSAGLKALAQSSTESSNAASQQIVQENKLLHLENQELQLEKEKIKQEKEELLKENERLITKMERLVLAFGGESSSAIPPQPSTAKGAEALVEKEKEKPKHQPKIVEVSKRANETSVAQTAAPVASTAPINPYKDAPPASLKNNDDLRKELNALDKEINSLSKPQTPAASASPTKRSTRAAK